MMKVYGIESHYTVLQPNGDSLTDTICERGLHLAEELAHREIPKVESDIKRRLEGIYPKGSKFDVRTKLATFVI